MLVWSLAMLVLPTPRALLLGEPMLPRSSEHPGLLRLGFALSVVVAVSIVRWILRSGPTVWLIVVLGATAPFVAATWFAIGLLYASGLVLADPGFLGSAAAAWKMGLMAADLFARQAWWLVVPLGLATAAAISHSIPPVRSEGPAGSAHGTEHPAGEV